jgi:hypothetical protein
MCRSIYWLIRATQHLHIFGHDAQTRTLLAARFVVPSIQLKPAFDEDLSAFLEILLRKFGLAAQSVTSTKVTTSFLAPSSPD